KRAAVLPVRPEIDRLCFDIGEQCSAVKRHGQQFARFQGFDLGRHGSNRADFPPPTPATILGCCRRHSSPYALPTSDRPTLHRPSLLWKKTRNLGIRRTWKTAQRSWRTRQDWPAVA